MTEKIAEAVDGFGQMNARQQTIHQWTVTSWRNDTTTVHQVNLKEGTCTCKDKRFNKSDEEACAHIMKANHQAQAQMDVGAALNHELVQQVTELNDHVEAIERKATGLQADQAAAAAGGAGNGDGEADDGFDGDPVEYMESLLRDAGLDPDDFEIWVDDDYGSLQADIDAYLNDDDFETWVNLKDEIDMSYDGDNDVNYLQADRFAEVFG